MIETNETLKGNINVSSSISGVVKNGVEYIEPLTQEKSVIPNIEEQVIVPDEGFGGLSKVIIEPVSLQTKESTPIEEEQTIIADDEFLGLKEVKIKSIPSEYKKPTGTKKINSNGEYNVASYEKALVNVEQKPPVLQEKSVTPNEYTQIISHDVGYTGLGNVTINPIPNEYVKPSGTLPINSNGTFDVSKYKTVITDVHESAGEQQYFTTLNKSGRSTDIPGILQSLQNIPDNLTITIGQNQFTECRGLLKIPALDYSNLTNCSYMFNTCVSLNNTTNARNFKKITNMSYMFAYCQTMTEIDCSTWDIQNVTTAQRMFTNNTKLKTVNISNWNNSKGINFSYMFYLDRALTTVVAENTLISGTINTNSMFRDCSNLVNLDLSWLHRTGNVDMSYMFYYCDKLQKLDIRNFDLSAVTTSSYSNSAFSSVPKTCEIIVMNDACKQWMSEKFSAWTNVKTVAELGE